MPSISSCPSCAMAGMCGLPITDRLVVLAIRAWAAAVRHDAAPGAAARAAFGAVGLADVASLIHALMTAIAHGARRPLDIAPPCGPRLTGDEGLILDAIALGRAAGGVDPALALRPVLTLSACRAAGHLCVELGRALADAGAALDGRLDRLGRRPAGSSAAQQGAGVFLQPVEQPVEDVHLFV